MFNSEIFDNMVSTAKEILSDAQKSEYTQAVVFLTSSKKEYYVLINNALSPDKECEGDLVANLKANDDTEISYVLCMWHDESVDLPSYDFRKMLLQMDERNANAEIFVLTESGYQTKPLETTLR